VDKKNTYSVPAVEKAMSILEYITHSKGGRTLKEIYSDLNISKTTTFSTLRTLTECGYVRKTSNGLFMPTLKMTMLGAKARTFAYDSNYVLPKLENLRDTTGFTVFFCVFDKGEQIVMEKVDGFGGVIFKTVVEQRKHINTSGGGKAMAAFLSPSELKAVLERGLKKLTESSIYEEKAFLEHLDVVRKQGYAIDDNEGEMGVRCIGVPVFMNDGMVYGSVSIATLSEKLNLSDAPKLASHVQAVAMDISKSLGYRGDSITGKSSNHSRSTGHS